MKRAEIEQLLILLNRELVKRNQYTTMFICGGTVMALKFNDERRTRDVDGIFENPDIIYELAQKIAREQGLDERWMNDSVRDILDVRFIDPNFRIDMSNLMIYYAKPEYMLALKCLACNRGRLKDFDDVKTIVNHLEIKTVDELINVVSNYLDPMLVYENSLRRIITLCKLR